MVYDILIKLRTLCLLLSIYRQLCLHQLIFSHLPLLLLITRPNCDHDYADIDFDDFVAGLFAFHLNLFADAEFLR